MEFKIKGSKDRFEAALELEEPDTLPIFEMGITPPIMSKIIDRTPYYRNYELMLEGYSKGKYKEVNRKWVMDEIECHRKLGLDAIRLAVHYILPSDIVVKRVGEHTWQIGESQWRYLPDINVLWPLDSIVQRGPEAVLRYIKEHWDETKSVHESRVEPVEIASKEVGDEMMIIGDADGTFLSHGPGMSIMLSWMYTHPDVVRKYIDWDTRREITYGKAQIDAGAEAIFMSRDYAFNSGPFMSPKHFHEFIAPSLKRHVNAFHRKGAYAIKHTDGNINLILDDIVDSGIDALQCLDPGAGMRIGEVKEKYGDKICLMGNMNIDTLSRKSVEEVEEEAKRCIRDASPGGGHIFCTSNDIATSVKFENFLAMINTARKYGKYPIKR